MILTLRQTEGLTPPLEREELPSFDKPARSSGGEERFREAKSGSFEMPQF